MIKKIIGLHLLFSFSLYAVIEADYTAKLMKENKVKIPEHECKEMEEKMGQLMYINVDGFGSKSAIDPAYNKLVKRLQVGGVLPHFGSTDPMKIKEANALLQDQTKLPLLIGVDYAYLKQPAGGTIGVGLGYGGGLAETIGANNVSCIKNIAKVDAALHKAMGINNPLGPTIEKSLNNPDGTLGKDDQYKFPRVGAIIDAFKEMGLETTLKHFPYTPKNYNLHSSSPDTKLPIEKVNQEQLPVFKYFANSSGMVMTTHLFNSEVDPNNMATFSKKWMKKLRDEVGFNGLVMTDALFMISHYPETMKSMARDFPITVRKDLGDDASLFAVKAILAGHDMFFLESTASVTEKIWKNLVSFSCSNVPVAKEFRDRVKESYDRITRYKKSNGALKVKMDVSKDEIEKLVILRTQQSDLCKMEPNEVDKIVSKFNSRPTEISCDVFCNKSGEVKKSIDSTIKENLLQNSTPKEIIETLSTLTGDNLIDYIDLIKKDTALLKKLDKLARDMALSKEETDNLKGVSALSSLELLKNDSSRIDMLIEKNDLRKIKTYTLVQKGGDLPTASSSMTFKLFNLIQKVPQKDWATYIQGLLSKETPLSVVMESKLPPLLKTLAFLRLANEEDYKKLSGNEIAEMAPISFNFSDECTITPATSNSAEQTRCEELLARMNYWINPDLKLSKENLVSLEQLLFTKVDKDSGKTAMLSIFLSKILLRGEPTASYFEKIFSFNQKVFEEILKRDPNMKWASDYLTRELYSLAFTKLKIQLPMEHVKAYADYIRRIKTVENQYLGDDEKAFIKSYPELFTEEVFKEYL